MAKKIFLPEGAMEGVREIFGTLKPRLTKEEMQNLMREIDEGYDDDFPIAPATQKMNLERKRFRNNIQKVKNG